MKWNRIIYTGLIVILIVTTFNPFKRKDKGHDVPRPWASKATIQELAEYIEAEATSPEQYLAELFDSRQIVFVGDLTKLKQSAVSVAAVIPLLASRGVRILGIEYALYDDQDRIDALLTADRFDRDAAARILFDRMVVFGYEEYVDIFEAAWTVNRNDAMQDDPFRIIGLDVKHNWEYIQEQDDVDDPAILRNVLSAGVPDTFMADVIRRECLDTGRQGLMLVSAAHAYTRYRQYEFERNMAEKGFSDTKRAGNYIYDMIGDQAVTVLVHAPWPDKRTAAGYNYPVGGVVDALLDDLPEEERTFGFDVKGSPFGTFPIYNKVYSEGYEEEELTFSEMTDGYLVYGLFSEYTAVTAIDGFITEDNLDEVVRNFPGPKDFPSIEGDTITASELNDYIAGDLAGFERFLQGFKY
jgi:hypothetical protein